MKLRWTALALVATLMSTFVLTPAVPAEAQGQGQGRGQNRGGLVLENVTGPLSGGTFTGAATITNLQYRGNQLLADGVLTGTAPGGQQINQQFKDVPLTLTSGSGTGSMSEPDMAFKQAGCEILNLDLGPIFLDLLGLEIDLAPVDLVITAVPGPGKLLGNLLCALVGLLDPGSGLSDLINDLLRIINRILGQL